MSSATEMPVEGDVGHIRVQGLPEAITRACGCCSSPRYWKKTASLSLTRPMLIIISTELGEELPRSATMEAVTSVEIAVVK